MSYKEMVKDPLATVREIYSHFDWELTAEAEANMRLHMEQHKQHKLGGHKYSLEEYGISDDEVRENLADFLEYFGQKEKLF